jgi:hypothetical protein
MPSRIIEGSFIDRIKRYSYRIKLLSSERALILRHEAPLLLCEEKHTYDYSQYDKYY